MGRSVSTLRNADKVIYVDLSETYESGELDLNFAWDDFMDDLYEAFGPYKSLSKVNNHEDENSIILENKLIQVAVSEYCGLASISMRAIENDYDHNLQAFGQRFIEKISDKVESKIKERYDVYRKQGTFSNGEGVYSKVD